MSSGSTPPSRRVPSISFGPEDQWFDEVAENPPMVITARLGTDLVKRILVDTGTNSNIMFRNIFNTLGLRNTDLRGHQHGVVGLGDNFIKPDRVVSLPVSIGGGRGKRSLMAEFVVLRDSTAYNLILGRKTINEFGAVICTKLLLMKFVADDGSVGTIRGDLETAIACDNASLSLRKKSREASGVFLADLDARVDDKPRPEPEGDLEKFRVGESDEKFTFVNRNLPHDLKEPLMEIIRANSDLFAWTPADMPGIDPQFMSHQLAVRPEAKPVAQRRRKMSQERSEEVAKQTASLLEAGFIRELDYSTWLSNMVLVKKPSGKWRMCMDYSDLNKVCPKDSFPLPNIDALVDAAAGYRGYIPTADEQGLQRPHRQDGGGIHRRHLGQDCQSRGPHRRPGKRLHLSSTTRYEAQSAEVCDGKQKLCAFAVKARKFLGFMITQREVEANPKKCEEILQMKSPESVKDVQRLAGRLTALSRFLGASAAKALPFFNLMKKGIAFEWIPACEEAFKHFKEIISAPPVLARPKNGEVLYLYLVVTDEALAAVLVREEGKTQQPIYFVSKALQGVELRYSKLEKVAYALLTSSRRLQQYFQGHQVIVRTDQAEPSWMSPIVDFSERAKLSTDEKVERTIRREVAKYAIIQDQLFKKGLSQPLLKHLRPDQTDYMLREVHERCCGHHIRGKALAKKLVRAGYYWPSMMEDSKEFVRRCKKCQENVNFHKSPVTEGKYLILAIDYYTKWIEAEPLASISLANCRKFMWRQVIARFGIPEVVISDNGTQFADKRFGEFLAGLGIQQKFSSVEHPQTNRQVEVANKVILQSLKKRLDQKKGTWADKLASVL
ncbi:uncharacterized protein LOC107620975 [Arachis ipaensis]|uniref:uncharacterized protein LOC107620975 n=1 Tax=Arachis ipaensis TaxID=130454 RepID=UPI0007AF31CD|nr:uncharacterized protein LOC107620975 [Arachis ipaensis]